MHLKYFLSYSSLTFKNLKVVLDSLGSFIGGSHASQYHPARSLILLFGNEQFQEVLKPESGDLNNCYYHLIVLRSCLCCSFLRQSLGIGDMGRERIQFEGVMDQGIRHWSKPK